MSIIRGDTVTANDTEYMRKKDIPEGSKGKVIANETYDDGTAFYLIRFETPGRIGYQARTFLCDSKDVTLYQKGV